MRLHIPALIFLATSPLIAGYDLHITRKDHWVDEVGPKITFAEWLAIVKGDPQIRKDPENGPRDFLVKIPGEEFPLWYDSERGEIYTKDPTKSAIKKMIEIAVKLRAKVQGDDGEIYPVAPNLSFNPDPTVRDNRHALDFRLSVGPVNFVR